MSTQRPGAGRPGFDVTEEMAFPPFSGDGKYLEVQYVGEMENGLGSPRDDSLNVFTARMLLLL